MAAKVGIIYDPLYLEHETGWHPENAGRLRAIEALLREQGRWDDLHRLAAVPASMASLTAVHHEGYLRRIEQYAQEGGGLGSPDGLVTTDTVVSPRSFEVARLAAGAAVRGVDAVLDGEADQAFALVRPPGHHARPGQAMGFCLINNVAVAARHAVRVRGLSRVLVLDFDVHHGNGTQEIFFDDPAVYYVSTHQYPAYPGTGALDEIGRGAGTGFTLNVPLPEGTGDAGFCRVFEELLAPAILRYRPELFLLSAGYDAHWTNAPYVASIQMNVTVAGFASTTRRIMEWAQDLCEGRAVFVLEGGYDRTALAWSVLGTLDVLEGRQPEDPIGRAPDVAEPDVSDIIRAARSLHGL